MIVDIERFVAGERRYWAELEAMLDAQDRRTARAMTLDEAQRFYYLYERTSTGLSRLAPLSVEAGLREYVESLVARAYGEVHEVRRRGKRPRPVRWFVRTFPRVFREHLWAFTVSLVVTTVGVIFGVVALAMDPASRRVLMPFAGLQQDPNQRVARERSFGGDPLRGRKSQFAAQLMTHNTRVAAFTMSLGITGGAGTAIVLFSNGAMLGAVAYDYVRAGQSAFLAGWLLPHGSIEIPAILVAGQAGLVFAGALIGWGSRRTRRERLRDIGPDLVTLVGGTAVMLVWAGIVEGFFSQYHEPFLPYSLKIGFGCAELMALTLFLWRAGGKDA
jgi:uncharacterized membrane protein SpoIIM required for sporulation